MGVVKHRLFWPIVALLTLVVINTVARPQFIKVTVRDGQLYGALIDILRNSAPLMLVALGMTIVIATRGIDLSVGAVMAVSGAVALTIIDDSGDPDNLGTVVAAVVAALLVALVLGSWNGILIAVLGIQPIIATLVLMLAGRGVALLITGGLHHHRQQWALRVHRHRVPAGPAVRVPHLLDGDPRDRRVRTPDGARHAHRGGGHQPGGEPPGGCPVARDHLQRVRRSAG